MEAAAAAVWFRNDSLVTVRRISIYHDIIYAMILFMSRTCQVGYECIPRVPHNAGVCSQHEPLGPWSKKREVHTDMIAAGTTLWRWNVSLCVHVKEIVVRNIPLSASVDGAVVWRFARITPRALCKQVHGCMG